MGPQRLVWLACALSAIASSASITASNESTAISSFNGHIEIETDPVGDGQGDGTDLAELVPLTKDAVLKNNDPLGGDLVYTTPDSAAQLEVGDVAYISCNTDDYAGNINADDVLSEAMNHNITAIVLYNTASGYCGYEGASQNLEEFPIYSMTKTDDSQKVLDSIKNMTSDKKYFVNIARRGSDNDQGPQQQGQGQGQIQNQNPLGPSPSTAVAMIILYSITGIITALFLIIIITGAIRAHRHPDRYGPRDVLGRPRQSRARGLGRAILDTLPIVKFGERETPKPTDVELGSTAEARNVDDANPDTTAQRDVPATETGGTEGAEAQRDVHTEQPSGIAPAQPLVAGAAAQDTSAADQGLGCSICTDDFEKGQDIRVLPCNHKFHPECVDPWLLNVSGTCPLCRVDLRPTTSRSSAGDEEQDPDSLAPPLQPETDMTHRRRSALRDIIYFRSRPDASSEERISALRRLREQRRNHSGDVSGSANASEEDIAAARRSRRISVRLSDVFHSRTRKRADDHDDPQPPPPIFGSGEPSSSQNQHDVDSTPNPSEPRETESETQRRS